MSSHVTVVESVIQGLKLAGVKDKNIIVFERYNRELEREIRLPALKQAKREPKHISTAAALGLGVDDLSKIKLIHI